MHRGKGMKFVGDSRVPVERKPNIPKDYSEYPGKTEAFWPNFLLKEWMVGAVFLIGYLSLTIAHPSPLEKLADPTDTGYTPLPDWYFLFLYQLLKYSYASGPYNTIGAFVIPGLAFGALLLAPFLDRGPERKPSKRLVPVGLMLCGLAATVYLTWEAAAHHDWKKQHEQGKIQNFATLDQADPGYKLLQKNTCVTCHGDNLQGGPAAPALQNANLKADEVAKIAREGKGGKMPPGVFKGTDAELKTLSEYVEKVSTKK